MTHITKLDDEGISFIARWEGMSLVPYKDGAGIPTIGIGATVYENGKRVTMADTPITKERAYELLLNLAKVKMMQVDSITPDTLNQNQFNALVSFCYNGGIGMLKESTMLWKINLNINDPSIKEEFIKFVNIHKDGKLVKLVGLVNRRSAEANLYFKPI